MQWTREHIFQLFCYWLQDWNTEPYVDMSLHQVCSCYLHDQSKEQRTTLTASRCIIKYNPKWEYVFWGEIPTFPLHQYQLGCCRLRFQGGILFLIPLILIFASNMPTDVVKLPCNVRGKTLDTLTFSTSRFAENCFASLEMACCMSTHLYKWVWLWQPQHIQACVLLSPRSHSLT